jgi:hypothetical protein
MRMTTGLETRRLELKWVFSMFLTSLLVLTFLTKRLGPRTAATPPSLHPTTVDVVGYSISFFFLFSFLLKAGSFFLVPQHKTSWVSNPRYNRTRLPPSPNITTTTDFTHPIVWQGRATIITQRQSQPLGFFSGRLGRLYSRDWGLIRIRMRTTLLYLMMIRSLEVYHD